MCIECVKFVGLDTVKGKELVYEDSSSGYRICGTVNGDVDGSESLCDCG